MSKVRGTSNAPLVLGIIGGVLGLPSAVCSGVCAAGIYSYGEASITSTNNDAGVIFLVLGLVSSIIAIAFAITSKSQPISSGVGLLIATVLSAITLFAFNLINIVVVILLLLASILSFVQKKEVIE